MKIGYACICLDAQFHFETCIQKFATEDRLRSIIRAARRAAGHQQRYRYTYT